jgi:hypothetical protein
LRSARQTKETLIAWLRGRVAALLSNAYADVHVARRLKQRFPKLTFAEETEHADENEHLRSQQTPLMPLRVLLCLFTLGGRTLAFKKGCQCAAFFVFK